VRGWLLSAFAIGAACQPALPASPVGANNAAQTAVLGPWVGPAGADGATGQQGPSGPAGLPGDTGATGPIGANGATGPAGPSGATGAVGNTGAMGGTGATGAQGPAGNTGVAGPKGVTGVAGAAGPSGATGALGQSGPNGIAGPKGVTGATGAQGPSGATGAKGSTGVAGGAGVKGPTGAAAPGTVMSVANAGGSVISVTNGTTNALVDITAAALGTNGYVTSATFTAFNNKVSTVTANAPFAVTGSTARTISMSQANGSTNGYLSSTDFNTFNGRVGSVGASSPINTTLGTNPILGVDSTCSDPKLSTWNGSSWVCRPALSVIPLPINQWTAIGFPPPAIGTIQVGAQVLRSITLQSHTNNEVVGVNFTVPVGMAGASPNLRMMFYIPSAGATPPGKTGVYEFTVGTSGAVAGGVLSTCRWAASYPQVTVTTLDSVFVTMSASLPMTVCSSGVALGPGDRYTIEVLPFWDEPGPVYLIGATVEY
jgi:hypothetical protein